MSLGFFLSVLPFTQMSAGRKKKKKAILPNSFLPPNPPPQPCLLLWVLEGDSDFLRRGPATLTCLAHFTHFITHPHSGVFLFFLFFQPLPPRWVRPGFFSLLFEEPRRQRHSLGRFGPRPVLTPHFVCCVFFSALPDA